MQNDNSLSRLRWLIACALLVFGLPLLAIDRVIGLYGFSPQIDPPETRSGAATSSFRSYINSGDAFTVGVDRLIVQYYDANNIQEIFSAGLINGEWYAFATGNVGRFASDVIRTGGGGGSCSGYPTTLVETGYWANYQVCMNGSCSEGSTWVHAGYVLVAEPVFEDACVGYII